MLPLVTHPQYSYEFDHGHRFPMQKFRLLHQYLREQGIATSRNTHRPGTAKIKLLQVAHCPDYLQRFVANKLDKKELIMLIMILVLVFAFSTIWRLPLRA